MEKTKLSTKGQIIIPKSLRTSHHWETGQELEALDMGDGVLLRPASPFPPTRLNDIASCLPYRGLPRTIEEMEEAIKAGAKEKA
jgi:AbrB family looped-hinge helix DNA binding protein